mgnify:CR=1 FL=1
MTGLLTSVAVMSSALAATLSVDTVDAAPGETGVAVPITLTAQATDEISAVVFTLDYDAALTLAGEVAAGPAATDAGKDVSQNIPGADQVRVVIASLNQNVIASGVVAIASFDVDGLAPGGLRPINLTDVSFSDPFGEPLFVESQDGGVRLPGGEGEGEGMGEPHCADQDADLSIDLSELLRVVQLFNSDGLHCDGATEDGYAPGPGGTDCGPHDSDYAPVDWNINISELLRLIQIYNSDGYHPCPGQGTEDGFCLGPS